MAYADHVAQAEWDARYDWLRQTEEHEAGVWGSILISPHGTLLTYDLEIAFCAGAWISVIILAHAAIDATIRDTELGDYRSNSKVVLGDDNELQWLRAMRNRLVHVNDPELYPQRTEEMPNDVASFQASFEADARRATSLVFRRIYASRGT